MKGIDSYVAEKLHLDKYFNDFEAKIKSIFGHNKQFVNNEKDILKIISDTLKKNYEGYYVIVAPKESEKYLTDNNKDAVKVVSNRKDDSVIKYCNDERPKTDEVYDKGEDMFSIYVHYEKTIMIHAEDSQGYFDCIIENEKFL